MDWCFPACGTRGTISYKQIQNGALWAWLWLWAPTAQDCEPSLPSLSQVLKWMVAPPGKEQKVLEGATLLHPWINVLINFHKPEHKMHFLIRPVKPRTSEEKCLKSSTLNRPYYLSHQKKNSSLYMPWIWSGYYYPLKTVTDRKCKFKLLRAWWRRSPLDLLRDVSEGLK